MLSPLVLTLFCCPFVFARYESVDCTILLEDPVINRQTIKSIASCVTSVNPYNQVEEESYCTTILSNNTDPENLSTIIANDQAECLVMAISSNFDTEFCTVTFPQCLLTSFSQIFDCNTILDCRPNRPDPIMYEPSYDLPSLTENESTSTTSIQETSSVPYSETTTTVSATSSAESTTTTTDTSQNTTTVCLPHTVVTTKTVVTTQPVTLTTTETETDFVTITLVDDIVSTTTPIITTSEIIPITTEPPQQLVCCWDTQCKWHSKPHEWCSKSEHDCIQCGGTPLYK